MFSSPLDGPEALGASYRQKTASSAWREPATPGGGIEPTSRHSAQPVKALKKFLSKKGVEFKRGRRS